MTSIINYWTEDDVFKLKEMFSNNRDSDISAVLNRSIKSISKKAHSLGLKKSKKHKSKMISLRNKSTSRDLNYNSLKAIAIIYKTRSEFQLFDGSAYQACRKMNILDDVCRHMVSQSFSIPQLILKDILSKILGNDCIYNTRKVIPPYELDIFFPIYKIAFEYNGKYWHKNDKVDKVEICKEKNIHLFIIEELSRKHEEDIKYQIIKIINQINTITLRDIKVTDIKSICIDKDAFETIVDIKEIQKICNKYINYSLFKKENPSLCRKIVKLKMENYTKHMIKLKRWNIESAIIEVEKYEYLGDFIKGSSGCYQWVKKNKKEQILENLKLKQNKKLKYRK